MIKTNTFIVVLLTIMTSIGCQNNVSKNRNSFVDSVNVRGELFMSADNLLDPWSINIYQNYLIIVNDNGEPQIEIYNALTKEKKASFLFKGNGPLEMLHVGNTQCDIKNGRLILYDLYRERLFGYDFEALLKNPNTIPEILYETRIETTDILFDKLMIKDGTLIGESRSPKGRIAVLDKNWSAEHYFINYPDKKNVDNRLSDIDNAGLYGSKFAFHPYEKKMASVTYTAGMIDLFDISDEQIETIWSYHTFYPTNLSIRPTGDAIQVFYTMESLKGYCDIFATNKYVYALFSGKMFKDKTNAYGNVVYVLDWRGEETFKIILDHSINRIAVSPDDKMMYGITQDTDIMRFSINEIIENE